MWYDYDPETAKEIKSMFARNIAGLEKALLSLKEAQSIFLEIKAQIDRGYPPSEFTKNNLMYIQNDISDADYEVVNVYNSGDLNEYLINYLNNLFDFSEKK